MAVGFSIATGALAVATVVALVIDKKEKDVEDHDPGEIDVSVAPGSIRITF